MLNVLFKITNPVTRIGVSNLKYEIRKSNIAKFGKNVKDILDDMYSNYTIFIDKGEIHEYYVCHLFRSLFSVSNPIFNCFIEITKD